MMVVSMSKKEFDRLEVLLGVQSGRLRIADACELLRLRRRQVFRLLAGLKHGGAALAFARERQASYPPNRKRADPRRRRPPNNLEAPGIPTKGRPSRKVLATATAE